MLSKSRGSVDRRYVYPKTHTKSLARRCLSDAAIKVGRRLKKARLCRYESPVIKNARMRMRGGIQALCASGFHGFLAVDNETIA